MVIYTRIPQYTSLSLSYSARIIRCYSYFIGSILFFFSNILNIFIIIERMTSFIIKLKKFTKWQPYKLCLSIFIFSILINTPFLFQFKVRSDSEFEMAMNNYSYLNNFQYSKLDSTFDNLIGKVFYFLIIFFRDILISFIGETALNFISLL